jgi:hypothetical protein
MAAVAAVVVVSTQDDNDNITRVPPPARITDAARRLQSRLWSVTYGLNVASINDKNQLDVTAWTSTLFAEYGHLLTSREPILEWPHFEPTRPATLIWTHCDLWFERRIPPLLWLLLLDDLGTNPRAPRPSHGVSCHHGAPTRAFAG